MKTTVNILAVTVLLIGGCVSLQNSSSRVGYDLAGVDKVAIVAVEGTVTSEAAKDQIADFFSMELLDKGYAPVGRTQVRAQLREQESDWQSLTTGETAVQAGLILDVPAVLAIKIPHFGEEISITAQMISVEDGSTLWLASGSGKGQPGLANMFGFGSNGTGDSQLLGDVMGGPTPLGGPVDMPLTPEEAERAQALIKKMCRSLPTKAAPEW
ncbi:MAG: hypothetical protein ACYTBS_20695 [Planctomycetota bacterium]|jgi:hypothetical protein